VSSTGGGGGGGGGANADAADSSEEGCYLVYDPDGCKLLLHYSKTAVPSAAGFWRPGPTKKIQGFKFKRNQGRSDLIGNCASGVAGRKNYYSGWCQFVRAARNMGGRVTAYGHPGRGLDVDVYLYCEGTRDGVQTVRMEPMESADVNEGVNAVACLPRHAPFVEGAERMDLSHWMTKASTVGAASRFE